MTNDAGWTRRTDTQAEATDVNIERMKPYRIGSGAGYAGDRIDPAQDLAERGQLDALVFECLAERTIALAQLRRLRDPALGYDPLLQARLRAVLPACVRQRTTVITNMGAANPLAAGQAVLQVARELGLARLRVAVITGDDVLAWMQAHDVPLIDSDQSVRSLDGSLISANAYLGADALLPALGAGADVVITGRVADPALFLAPLMHHFGWSSDDWARMGQGIVVGHLLECAAQVSGGYLADPGFVEVAGLHEVGFPLAEVLADGSAVITKLAGTGGRVDRLSCTAQLLYEIEDPARYLQPDVVADFSGVRFGEIGSDRVQVMGATGHPRPDQLKATLGYRDGFIGEGQISYAGPGARARGEMALAILAQRLKRRGLAACEHRAELIGVNAMHGPLLGTEREPYEVRVRLAVRCTTQAEAEIVGQEVEALYLNGPAAGGGVTQSVREVIAAASALIPRAAVPTHCHILEL
jgi:Acyclic terpene utilisation family protein AtuA